jgi:hypothetical protein
MRISRSVLSLVFITPFALWSLFAVWPATVSEDVPKVVIIGEDETNLRQIVATYGSMPKGVTVESTAEGFEPIAHVAYDHQYNHFILNGISAYKSPLSVEPLVELLDAVRRDTRVGISLGLGGPVITYGAVKPKTQLANDFIDLDLFISFVVFGDILGKKKLDLPGGYQPKFAQNRKIKTTVYANFTEFQFVKREGFYTQAASHLDLLLVPLKKELAKDGGWLPDMEAFRAGRLEETDKANVEHLRENLAEYRKRPEFVKIEQYGQCAAFFRYLRDCKVDLDALLKTITDKPRAPIDVCVYYSPEDPRWPAIDEAVQKVERLWSRLRVERISTSDGKGQERLAEEQKRLKTPPLSGSLLAMGPYWLMGEEKGRGIPDYFAWMAARVQYPEMGKGRLPADIEAYVRRVFGLETTARKLREKNGIIYFEVLKGGNTLGYVADAYRANSCPSCGDTQFLLAVGAPQLTVGELTPIRSPERWGKPLFDSEIQTFRNHFLGFSQKSVQLKMDAVTGATNTVTAYENMVTEILKELETAANK